MVNINSFEAKDKPINVLKEIFENQKALMEKYWTKPVGDDIDTLKGSQEIRKFSKYTVEELAEAYEAYLSINFDWNMDHVYEEMIDSLHFFVEKMIISNIDYEDLLYYWKKKWITEENLWDKLKDDKVPDTMAALFWHATYWVNIPDNRLRNKEWKNEQIATNRELFYKESCLWFYEYLLAFYSLGIDEEQLWDLYSRKNQVNHFRIKSNY